LQLFKDQRPKSFRADRGKPRKPGKRKGSFFGRSSDGSTISLVESENGLITGNVVDPATGIIYHIAPNAKRDEMIVTEIDTSDMPREDDADGEDEATQGRHIDKQTDYQSLFEFLPIPPTLQGTSEREHGDRLLVDYTGGDDRGGNLDVLVVWTGWAECGNSDLRQGCDLTPETEENMRDLIDLAIEETNDAFTASGISTSLRLVHAYRADETYVETSSSEALNSLRADNDGVLDDVHTKRTEYGADIVSMILELDGMSCGRAKVGPGIDKMFSVSDWSCATGYYSFGHEIAHNLVSSTLTTKIPDS
jgi:hypothetical protein